MKKWDLRLKVQQPLLVKNPLNQPRPVDLKYQSNQMRQLAVVQNTALNSKIVRSSATRPAHTLTGIATTIPSLMSVDRAIAATQKEDGHLCGQAQRQRAKRRDYSRIASTVTVRAIITVAELATTKRLPLAGAATVAMANS